MTNSANTRLIESLAAEIGENIYIDVAKWHLYLRDAHLHTLIAQRVLPLLENNSLSEREVKEILQGIMVTMGGGKTELPLINLIPRQGESELMNILLEFQRNFY
jgi:hypothetical protein